MPLRVQYGTADGNTVPYPALFNNICRNHGFVDTRGIAERVSDIPEAQLSEALRAVLEGLVRPDSSFASLGCDLGEWDRRKGRLSTRKWAGGYVQVVVREEGPANSEFEELRDLAKAIEEKLRRKAGDDRWELRLILTAVRLNFEIERHTQSAWIWFDAKASTNQSALASRERLLIAVGEAIDEFKVDG